MSKLKRTKLQDLEKSLAVAYGLLAWLMLGNALDSHSRVGLVAWLVLAVWYAFMAVIEWLASRPADEVA